jgi:hypothetical protein
MRMTAGKKLEQQYHKMTNTAPTWQLGTRLRVMRCLIWALKCTQRQLLLMTIGCRKQEMINGAKIVASFFTN